MQQIGNIGANNGVGGLSKPVKSISVKLTSGFVNATLRYCGVDESTSSTTAIGIGIFSGIYLGLNIFESLFSACVGEGLSRNFTISLPAESVPFKEL